MALAFTSARAQVRIGYTNVELILAYLPETKTIQSDIEVFYRKKMEELKSAQEFGQVKLDEYEALKQANRLSPEEAQRREEELLKLDGELRKKQQDAEFAVEARRMELLQPVMEKLQNTIDAVAKEKGFTYILNQTTSAGVSTILYGPDEDDITEEVMKRLGVTIPEGE